VSSSSPESLAVQDEIDELIFFHETWLWASSYHAGQLYPGSGLPYLTHIAQVVFSLLPGLRADPSLDRELAISCAILHDTVEDTKATLEDILRVFGPEIARGVSALTKNPDMRKFEATLDSLKRIRECPREIWLVKLADRIANLGPRLPTSHWKWEKIRAYAQEGRLILEALGRASELLALILEERIANWEKECQDHL
jgi:(p)ppGpp synthase/HD superfamily hydrolase